MAGYMTEVRNDKGSKFTFHGVGTPDKKHCWLDLAKFRARGNAGIHDVEYGDFVVTSMQAGTSNSLHYVGYIVQIRRDIGVFGSDLVIIRHPDGELMQHVNQFFWKLSVIDADTVLKNSNTDPSNPEDDNINQPYTLNGKFPETGFIIEAPKTEVK